MRNLQSVFLVLVLTLVVSCKSNSPLSGQAPNSGLVSNLGSTPEPVVEAESGSNTTREDQVLTGNLSGRSSVGAEIAFDLVDQPVNGKITIDRKTGEFRYQSSSNFFGVDQFSFQVTDGVRKSKTKNYFVNVIGMNDAPVAISQNVKMREDTQRQIQLSGRDVEKETLSFRIVSAPQHGKLLAAQPSHIYPDSSPIPVPSSVPSPLPATRIHANADLQTPLPQPSESSAMINGPLHSSPFFLYSPDKNFNGKDSFTFLVNDSRVNSEQVATIQITVDPVNDSPVAQAKSYKMPDLAKALNGVLTGMDVDGDVLGFEIVTAPTRGVVRLIDDRGSFVYTAGSGKTGEDSFRFVAIDPSGRKSQPELISVTLPSLQIPKPKPTLGAIVVPSSSR